MPFETREDQQPYHKAPEVPRFLYRAWSPASDGTNHHTGFTSLAHYNGLFRRDTSHQHLYGHHRADARDILKHHIEWKSRQCCPEDLLISFTSSFLHVLIHALYKIQSTRQCPRTTQANCWITIIDTSKLPQHTFLKTTYLLRELKIGNWGAFDRWKFNQGEYLAEYALDLSRYPGSSHTVLIGYLIHAGRLFSVIPELGDAENFTKYELFMMELRRQRFRQSTVLAPTDIVAARRFGVCFPEHLRPMMRVWALAMAKRNTADPLLLLEFDEHCYAGLDRYFLFKSDTGPVHHTLTDLKYFKRLMGMALEIQDEKR